MYKSTLKAENYEAGIQCSTVKTHTKEHMFWNSGRFSFYREGGCFLQNQPESVPKLFLKLFTKILYCIDYQQMKSMCKYNILINLWTELTLTALIKTIILCCGRGSSSGDKQLKTQQKSSKFEIHQLPFSLFM